LIIEQLEIKNFRCIKEESLKCGALTALLGRNGSGKSAFLHALTVFYALNASVSKEDFFNHDTNGVIEIRITFGSLRDDEKEEFKPYIKDDKLIVTKRITFENEHVIQKYYGATLQIPIFAEMRSLPNKTETRKAWNELVEQPGSFVGLGIKARSADEAISLMNEYEANHPELLETLEQEHQFFGSKNIGGGKLDKFTKFVFIPAVKDASDEVSGRRGSIYQILDAIVLRKIESRRDLQEFKEKVNIEARRLYCSDNLKELPELGESISNTLEMFAPGSKLKLDWQEFEMPDIQVPAAVATLIEDNFEGEISHKGHGLQRALVFTLLQHLALMVPEETETEEEELEENEKKTEHPVDTTGYVAPDLILSIEEPELYLHPSRCRYMCDLLYQLAEKPGKNLSARNQVIYSTHSPFLLNLDQFETIRLIRKRISAGYSVPHSQVTSYTFHQMAQELAKICEVKPTDFTRDSVKARATSIMNTMINEGFFADVVVVVEGTSDIGILWKLQELMCKNWAQLNIVIVPAVGKNKIGHPTLIFRGLSIPTYFIFDADSHLKGKGEKKEKDTVTRNKGYLRLAGANVEDFPETQVHESWAVFNDSIESELRIAIGNVNYETIRRIVADELGYSEADKAIKNLDGAAKFIEYAYEKGMRVPILEDIVSKVTALHTG
jgi:predicted ATP-dependent endonuclease of OLD family